MDSFISFLQLLDLAERRGHRPHPPALRLVFFSFFLPCWRARGRHGLRLGLDPGRHGLGPLQGFFRRHRGVTTWAMPGCPSLKKKGKDEWRGSPAVPLRDNDDDLGMEERDMSGSLSLRANLSSPIEDLMGLRLKRSMSLEAKDPPAPQGWLWLSANSISTLIFALGPCLRTLLVQ